MLYKFKSRAAPDLIMLEPHGRRLLQIVGKPTDEARGILLPAQMPGAIAALQAAMAEEDAQRQAATAEAQARGEPPPRFDDVTLRQRATPFIDMLRRCAEADKDIVWGV